MKRVMRFPSVGYLSVHACNRNNFCLMLDPTVFAVSSLRPLILLCQGASRGGIVDVSSELLARGGVDP